MYGLLCESLHDFIKESYGDDVWKLVRERADVRLHSFVTHQVRDCIFKITVSTHTNVTEMINTEVTKRFKRVKNISPHYDIMSITSRSPMSTRTS